MILILRQYNSILKYNLLYRNCSNQIWLRVPHSTCNKEKFLKILFACYSMKINRPLPISTCCSRIVMSNIFQLQPITLKHLVLFLYSIFLLPNLLLLNRGFTHFPGRNAWFLIRITLKPQKYPLPRWHGNAAFLASPSLRSHETIYFRGFWFCETLSLSIKIGNRRIYMNINSPCRENRLLYDHREGIWSL